MRCDGTLVEPENAKNAVRTGVGTKKEKKNRSAGANIEYTRGENGPRVIKVLRTRPQSEKYFGGEG